MAGVGSRGHNGGMSGMLCVRRTRENVVERVEEGLLVCGAAIAV